jgi:RHS repeat-associated protein
MSTSIGFNSLKSGLYRKAGLMFRPARLVRDVAGGVVVVLIRLILLIAVAGTSSAHGDRASSNELVPVSRLVHLLQKPMAYDPATGLFETTVIAKNHSRRSTYAPARIVLARLQPSSAELVGADGLDARGRPYVELALTNGVLKPRETSPAERLQFRIPRGRHRLPPHFQLKLLASLTPRNNPPVANAGADVSARVGEIVELDGSGSTDSDGDTLSYRWSLVARPEASAAVIVGAESLHPTLSIDRPGRFEVALVVSDGQVDSSPDHVLVDTTNSKPTADAGPDATVFVGSLVQLDGTASRDPDGDSLSHRWTLKAQPDSSTTVLEGAGTATPNFQVDRAGHYEIELIVNDGAEDSDPDTVFVDTENSRPVANAGPDQTVTAGSPVRLDGTVSTDADGDPLTFKWSLLSVPAGSQAVLAEPEEPTITWSPDRAGSYVAQLLVTDGLLESLPDTVEVTAVPKPNSPPSITSSPQVRATLGQLYSYAVEAHDPDGDVLNYTLQVSPSGLVIDPLSGFIQWTPLENQIGVFPVRLSADDGHGGSDIQIFDISVEPDASRTIVPTLVGLLRPLAELACLQAGLRPAELRFEADSLTEGTVIAQQPSAGSIALRGTDCSLVISLGPDLGLPPNPVTVAPRLDPTAPTTTSAASEFLYQGNNPVQTGVSAGAMDPRRLAVVRGRVLDRHAEPLPGAVVTVKDHPELGRTLTRADGGFDLAVNGGGTLVLQFTKPGYLPSQRHANPVWQDYVVLEDVLLMDLDAKSSEILTGPDTPPQLARGSVVSDENGSRQTSVVFPAGVQTSVVMADGSTQTLSSMTVRATEFTVGSHGARAMPAPLPPSSGYTYAVELSVDEALAAGAEAVRFDRPVPVYVDNFLGFPVGTPVPAGYYDRQKAAWVPSENGRVVKLLAVSDQMADIDGDGDGTADDSGKLAALGVTEDERLLLAQRLEPGSSFWRVPVTHFTPWDFNWPFGPPADAKAPLQPAPSVAKALDDPDCQSGSIIECQTQTLGEALPVAGTSMTLHYRSDRTAGRRTAHVADIPLTGASVAPSLKRVELEIQIAGRRFNEVFPATPNQSKRFAWDGLDAYGRHVTGVQTATIRVGYTYDAVYQTPANLRASFGAYSGVPMTGSRARRDLTMWQIHKVAMGSWQSVPLGLGGWTLSVHHVYDANGHALYRGDGGRQSADAVSSSVITTVAGGCLGASGEEGPATKACLNYPNDVLADPKGGYYISDGRINRIWYVDPQGIIHRAVGGLWGFAGDGGPASAAKVYSPQGISLGPDGSLYFADWGNHRVRRVDPAGIISTIAGTGTAAFGGDGGPATQAQLNYPEDVAAAPDGTVYIADTRNSCIRKVDPDGIISTLTAYGSGRLFKLGVAIGQVQLDRPAVLAVDRSGVLYIGASGRIIEVGSDGIARAIAGNGGPAVYPEGVPATQSYVHGPLGLSIGPDRSLYIAAENRLQRVGPDGLINSLVGVGRYTSDTLRDGGPPLQAGFRGLFDSSVGPDGSLYVVDADHERVRRIAPALPSVQLGETAIPSSDGSEVYVFDQGRHVRTLDALNKAILYNFVYDDHGLLTSLTDADGLVTWIERDPLGNPIAILAPFGQRTELMLDEKGYLASLTVPGALTHRMSYTSDGLLTRFTDPEGHATTFAYDESGRLVEDKDAAGGTKRLGRSEQAGSYTVNLTSARGATTTYLLEDQASGTQRRRTTFPDGTWSETTIAPAAVHKTSLPDGTTLESVLGGDPRFGMQAPLTSSAKIVTGGLTQTVTAERTAALANPGDLFSLTKLTDKITVNGRAATSVYDAAARTVTWTSPAGRSGKAFLDMKGRVVRAEAPGLLAAVSTYDAQGRLTAMSSGPGADERVMSFAYREDGHLAGATDALGRTVHYDYDAAGRIIRQTLPDGQEIRFAHDRNGNLVELIPPERPVHRFAYNAVSLTESYLPPAISSGGLGTRFDYDLDRHPVRVERPDGVTLDFGYDTAGRLASLVTPEGQVSYRYDGVTGKPTAIELPGGSALSFAYNGALPVKTTWTGDLTGSVAFTYDNDFRVTSILLNDADPVAYKYDADSLLTQAGALALTRNAQNGLLNGTALGVTTQSLQYSGFGEVTGEQVNANEAALIVTRYSYDKGGRIIAINETIGAESRSDDYLYDQAGRLTEVRRNGLPLESYGYDGNGNRTHVDGSPVAQYDDQDRLLRHGSAEYQYTANGELQRKTVGGAITEYRYDAFGNLKTVELSGGGRIEYLVDGANRRIGKKVDGTLVKAWLYQDALKPIAEFDGDGNLASRFVYATHANVPDYMVRGGNTFRFVTDHLGSPRLIVNTADGTVVQRIDYGVWGKVIFDSNPGFQPFGYAGGLYDRDTGLVRFGARDYDPETGRFTAKDPILFAGGSTNLYGYVLNDPVNLTDPSGLVIDTLWDIGNLLYDAYKGNWCDFAADAAAAAIPFAPAGITKVARGVSTPYGLAKQSLQKAALAARTRVQGGETMYRIGTTGKSQAAEAQFWALEHPFTPGFAQRFGIPPENVLKADFVEAATIRPGSPFVTRVAPAVGTNSGGGIEVVVPEAGVQLRWFSYGGL